MTFNLCMISTFEEHGVPYIQANRNDHKIYLLLSIPDENFVLPGLKDFRSSHSSWPYPTLSSTELERIMAHSSSSSLGRGFRLKHNKTTIPSDRPDDRVRSYLNPCFLLESFFLWRHRNWDIIITTRCAILDLGFVFCSPLILVIRGLRVQSSIIFIWIQIKLQDSYRHVLVNTESTFCIYL